MNNISWTGTGVIVSLLIGLFNFYFNFLRNAKYKIGFSYFKIIELHTTHQKTPDSTILLPAFSIVNIGHKPGLIEDILITVSDNKDFIKSFPSGKINKEAFSEENPSLEESQFHSATPFHLFVLKPGDSWESSYSFSAGEKILKLLQNSNCSISISLITTSKKWKERFTGNIHHMNFLLPVPSFSSKKSFFYLIDYFVRRQNEYFAAGSAKSLRRLSQ